MNTSFPCHSSHSWALSTDRSWKVVDWRQCWECSLLDSYCISAMQSRIGRNQYCNQSTVSYPQKESTTRSRCYKYYFRCTEYSCQRRKWRRYQCCWSRGNCFDFGDRFGRNYQWYRFGSRQCRTAHRWTCYWGWGYNQQHRLSTDYQQSIVSSWWCCRGNTSWLQQRKETGRCRSCYQWYRRYSWGHCTAHSLCWQLKVWIPTHIEHTNQLDHSGYSCWCYRQYSWYCQLSTWNLSDIVCTVQLCWSTANKRHQIMQHRGWFERLPGPALRSAVAQTFPLSSTKI